MPREENKDFEEERRARTAYDLMRIRLKRLEKNIFLNFQDKPVSIPTKREESKPRPPPEFVRNVVGSSAAAGSAEFHIFRNNKRRELERLEYIEKMAVKEEKDKEFAEKKRARKEEEDKKSAKKREKRMRQKARRKGAKRKKGGNDTDNSSSSEEEEEESKNTQEKHSVTETSHSENITGKRE